MSEVLDERIAGIARDGTLVTTLTLGPVQVSVGGPAPVGSAGLTAEALRAAAIRSARRVLEVALEELASEAG